MTATAFPVPAKLVQAGSAGAPYLDALRLEDLPLGTMRRWTHGELDILLVHLDRGIVALDDRCPHMSAPLSIGDLEGCVVGCPLHEGRFDLCTGDPVQMPTTGGLDPDGIYHATWSPAGRDPKVDPPGKKAEARRLTRVRRLRYYPVRVREGRIEVALPPVDDTEPTVATGTGDPAQNPIVVVEYDPAWVTRFETLRASLAPVLGGVADAIEHVGSTSVPGLAAKPIIDIDIVVADADAADEAIARLERVGYVHLGDLGIEGREAFGRPPGSVAHNLYVCLAGSVALRNHLAIRDRLRADPSARDAYASVKRSLARQTTDIDEYGEGKSGFLLGILADEGFDQEHLDEIAQANRRP